MVTEMYEMEDVPEEVWNSVYEKWAKARKGGWSYELWKPCALCYWVEGKEGNIECDRCPLMEDEWCTSDYHESKLSIGYDEEYGDEDDWEKRVIEFLNFIKPYCLMKG